MAQDKAELALAHAFEALEPYELIRVVEHGRAWGIMEPNGPWAGMSDEDHTYGWPAFYAATPCWEAPDSWCLEDDRLLCNPAKLNARDVIQDRLDAAAAKRFTHYMDIYVPPENVIRVAERVLAKKWARLTDRQTHEQWRKAWKHMARLGSGRNGPIFCVERLRSLSGLSTGITVTDADGADIWLSCDVLAHLFSVTIKELERDCGKHLSVNEILNALCDCPKTRDCPKLRKPKRKAH